MADTSGLASVIAGNDPESPLMLQAIHGEQARDYVGASGNWQGGGLLGGLARLIAGATTPDTTQIVSQIAADRAAARPDEAKLYAADDPYKAAAANPGAFNPLALAGLLSGTPSQIEQARGLAAQAGTTGLNLGGYRGTQALMNGGGSAPVTGPLSAKGGGAITGAVPTADTSILGTGRPPQPVPAAQMPAVDPVVAGMNGTPQQRAAIGQNPQMRAQALARLRAMQAAWQQQAQQSTQSGAPNAARP